MNLRGLEASENVNSPPQVQKKTPHLIIIQWCEALSSIFEFWRALRADLTPLNSRMTSAPNLEIW